MHKQCRSVGLCAAALAELWTVDVAKVRPGVKPVMKPCMYGMMNPAEPTPAAPFRVAAIRVVALLLAVLVPAVLVLVGVEAVARLQGPAPHQGRYIPDPLLNHAFAPNLDVSFSPKGIEPYAFRTNSMGLRASREYAIPKPAGVFRILICGDSFVEGFSEARSMPAAVAVALGPTVAARGLQLEVINAGVGSYAPTLHYFALLYRWLQLQPDLVVLVPDVTDAYDDAVRYAPLVMRDNQGMPVGVAPSMTSIKRELRRRMITSLSPASVDFWVAAGAEHLVSVAHVFDAHLREYLDAYPDLVAVIRSDVEHFPIYDIHNPQTAQWLSVSLTWIERIDVLLKQRGVPMVLATYPHLLQLQQPPLADYFAAYAPLAQRLGILHHHVDGALRVPEGAQTLYIEGDMHMNEAGLTAWGADLGAFLRAHLGGWLP